jgi:hypothetical protein
MSFENSLFLLDSNLRLGFWPLTVSSLLSFSNPLITTRKPVEAPPPPLIIGTDVDSGGDDGNGSSID